MLPAALRHFRVFLTLLLLTGLPLIIRTARGEDQPAREAESDEAAELSNVIRPTVPDEPPDPDELDIRPEANGKMRFNFHGQPWLRVVEWLADVSNLSLDWQELPAGFLNLRTEREYTLEEARDLINRHLLDRQFTLLKHGEILSVVPIKKLDPSLVPWLTPDELAGAQPHDFARVLFPLDSLTAETAAEEFKSLLSPNGNLVALKSTNRLEAMDAVANLRQIQKLLTDEQSPHGQERLVREFKLKHVRASEVQSQLQKLLGLDKSNPTATQNTDPAALVQQMAQIITRGASRGGSSSSSKAPEPPPVYLIADPRDNSILAHAPAEQMAVITQAIKVIDTPSDKSRSLLRNNHRMQVYPLAVAEPEMVVKLLQDLGDLDPATRIQADKKRRAIVAHAPLTDHVTIRLLIEKIDGQTRNFRVIRLSRVEADYVASAIDLVMGGGDGGKRQPVPNPNEDELRRFRVVADVEHNRLLLWVNDGELQEEETLLAELGESPASDADPHTAVRIIETPRPAETDKLFQRLKAIWPTVSPNPLQLGPRAKEDDLRSSENPAAPNRAQTESTLYPIVAEPLARGAKLWTAVRGIVPSTASGSDVPRDAASADAPGPPVPRRRIEVQPVSQRGPESPAPVVIDRDAQGRIVISSEDELAAELAKKMLGEIASAPADFQVFRMKHKHTSAYAIVENLKQIFDQKQKTDRTTTGRFFDPGSGKWINNSRDGEPRFKPKPGSPRFTVDMNSNSILVVGADAGQREAIGQIIDAYDVPESKDPLPARVTKLIKIEHAQVRQIAESIKDVYRDLLTVTETAHKNDQKERLIPEPRYTFGYSSADGLDPLETQVKFKGQLSIGVDEPSNSLIVSAPAALLEDVARTIASLDEASLASGMRVRVVQVNRHVNAAEFHKRMQRIATRPQPSSQKGEQSARP